MLVAELRGDVLHVLARVALRRHGDGAAVQLLVAQVDRARERLHLRAVVVHVVLADDVEAGPAEQALHAVAHDRVPAVADVHRAGRVRGDVLDDDLLPLPDLRAAPVLPRRDRALERGEPDVGRERAR